jgi:hypothetical protein
MIAQDRGELKGLRQSEAESRVGMISLPGLEIAVRANCMACEWLAVWRGGPESSGNLAAPQSSEIPVFRKDAEVFSRGCRVTNGYCEPTFDLDSRDREREEFIPDGMSYNSHLATF